MHHFDGVLQWPTESMQERMATISRDPAFDEATVFEKTERMEIR